MIMSRSGNGLMCLLSCRWLVESVPDRLRKIQLTDREPLHLCGVEAESRAFSVARRLRADKGYLRSRPDALDWQVAIDKVRK
jgi:hypothetical protein